MQTEVVSLRNALSESEAKAIRLAKVAKDDLGKVHETLGQWQRRAAELDQQNKRFKDMLDRHVLVRPIVHVTHHGGSQTEPIWNSSRKKMRYLGEGNR